MLKYITWNNFFKEIFSLFLALYSQSNSLYKHLSTSCSACITCCCVLKIIPAGHLFTIRATVYFLFHSRLWDPTPQWKISNLVLQPPPHPGSALIWKYQTSAQHLLPTQCLQRGLDMKSLYPFENKVGRKHWNQQKNVRAALSGRVLSKGKMEYILGPIFLQS